MEKVLLRGALLLICVLKMINISAQVKVDFEIPKKVPKPTSSVITGAERMVEYLPFLEEKRVALIINQTSIVGHTNLADTLQKRGIHITKIFVPEHGFRGMASAGEPVKDTYDKRLNVPIVSLYGKHLKPSTEDLNDVDMVVYDLQDVGCRFYTYISTLQYMIEACTSAGKPMLILDRPNPNGYFVDGPVLDTNFRSFVGLQPVPIVYGMTVAEYATMLAGEGWLKNHKAPELYFMRCKNYNHHTFYTLPVPPSPNLQDIKAIYLYPSLCLFEGTKVSVGRGTDKPYMQFGFPGCTIGDISFQPKSMPGANKPIYEHEICSGFDLSPFAPEAFTQPKAINLSYLLDMYNNYTDKDHFFIPFFDQLAGTDELRKMIMAHKTESQIKQNWQKDLQRFKTIRKKYLLYSDFE